MANQLKMALIETILTLHQRRWSQRRIARELNIHRETVARYLREASGRSKPAKAPIGSEALLALLNCRPPTVLRRTGQKERPAKLTQETATRIESLRPLDGSTK